MAADGSIDWLCLPDLDSGSVFGALLDAERGGAFRLAPTEPFAAERRYVEERTCLRRPIGRLAARVRVTDAMPLPLSGLAPTRELVRSIDGLSGEVPMRWTVEPRFGYGESRTRIGRPCGMPVAAAGADAIAVLSFEAGEPQVRRQRDRGGVRRAGRHPGAVGAEHRSRRSARLLAAERHRAANRADRRLLA